MRLEGYELVALYLGFVYPLFSLPSAEENPVKKKKNFAKSARNLIGVFPPASHFTPRLLLKLKYFFEH